MKVSKNPTTWAIICAFGVPLSFIIFPLWGILDCWTVSEIGTIIAAFAGPLAGLSGFLYVGSSLIEQRNQASRNEKILVFEKFLDTLGQIRNQLFFEAIQKHKIGEIPKRIRKDKDDSFDLLRDKIYFFYISELDNFKPEIFKRNVGEEHFYSKDVKWESLELRHAKTLIKAVAGDIFFGQYFKVFNFLVAHIRLSNLPEFLPIIESSFGTFERRFLFHYCPTILPKEDVIFLKQNGFLEGIQKKHWSDIFKNNYWNQPEFGKETHNLIEEFIIKESNEQ